MTNGESEVCLKRCALYDGANPGETHLFTAKQFVYTPYCAVAVYSQRMMYSWPHNLRRFPDANSEVGSVRRLLPMSR
jgi:hypothetical protein